MSARLAAAPTFSAVTTTSRARPIVGLDVMTLPFYYGLAEDAWRHWCRVWEVDYDWMLSRFVSKKIHGNAGHPS